MLDHLIEHHPEDRFGEFFRDLRNEIYADQQKLSDLVQKVGAEESAIRKVGASLAEKFGRAKFGDTGDSVELLQAVEGLALGITGKRLLWHSLETISANFPELQGVDFDALEQRARDQFTRLETLRMGSGCCSMPKMSTWKRTRRFRISGSYPRTEVNRAG